MNIISPSIHFGSDGSFITIVEYAPESGGSPFKWSIVTSDFKKLDAKAINEFGSQITTLPKVPLPFLCSRWNPSLLDEYLRGEKPKSTHSIFLEIKGLLSVFIDPPEEATLDILSLYTIMTYVFPLFSAIPYLFTNGPKASGKSRVISVLEQLVLNPVNVTSISEAAFFRCAGGVSSTILQDEFEQASDEFLQILNSGYKRNAGRHIRCSSNGSTTIYDPFGPKVLSSISRLNATTMSRCIQIKMLPSGNSTISRSRIDDYETDFTTLRAHLYNFALTRWAKVNELMKEVSSSELSLSNREFEIWLPILTLARMVDRKETLGLYDKILKHIASQKQESNNTSPEIYYLLMILRERLGNSSCYQPRPSDLQEDLKDRLEEELTCVAIGKLLTTLGFKSKRTSQGTKYQITKSKLNDLETRFLSPS